MRPAEFPNARVSLSLLLNSSRNNPPPTKSPASAGWAGLFSDYLFPTIVIGFVSVACLLLVYSLNTWLPKIMLPVLGQNGSLALLLVLNGGAMVGTLYGSYLADRHSPKRIVGLGFLLVRWR
jgi:AAHS family benzoate transporter-like MFS transporter